MNYLAHLFLSGRDEGLILGNFLGDFIRNRDLAGYPPRVQAGIRLHRAIDAYTDRHPLVRQGVRRLYPQHGRYGAVIVDVFYDHLLHRNWATYSQEDFDAFRQRVYGVLLEGRSLMPEPLQGRVAGMTGADWLAGYARLDGIGHSIERLQRRASQPERMEGALRNLEASLEAYEQEFRAFFPSVMRFVQSASED